ncbi:TPA: ATP-dependent DNA helicase RecG [Candidatus Peribacteria bacterium]|nr:MAG: hypothetical protein A2529_05445 [Candidatus Peribacteria bacterium RIFOXYD2_FULL_58_15]OGJ83879.1 MAG: hypothetical protein A3J91_02745 [Candidatus Peribacteria bacterium RIFOXYC2_FULL_58_10]HAI98534.1 ATP-dependent DNA helicase RecG [Candidatus Peribacteria bacterium]HAS34247.1 ATP-dependent DNA helicase RecG [Candidatus Peribacteria bacterium]
MQLTTPLHEVLRTTREYIDALRGLQIETVQDLLLYFPRSHEDLSQLQTLASAPEDAKATIRGVIDHIKLVRTRKGRHLVTAKFTDAEGSTADVVWFNQPHVKRMLKEGEEVVLTGKVVEDGFKLVLQSPAFERADRPLIHSGRLVPIYPAHDRITTKWLREKMSLIREAIDLLPETLPQDVVKEEKLLGRAEAVRALHFPQSPEEVEAAMQRLAFEEMYRIQTEVLTQKKEWQGLRQERLKIPMDVVLIRAFFQSLNFTPTNSQKIAIYEILKDMERDRPMSRLLEGDVGSGKTLVATAVIANVMRAGGQCALMVPTEVLAKQHAQSITRVLITFHTFLSQQHKSGGSAVSIPLPRTALLTGSTPSAEAHAIKQATMNGTVDLLIGTHALIMESVRFKDLRFVIVDEQHRFGVEQRQRLKEKGSPHFLAMTATPIPRTLALTAYGHHDLSVLLEKPGSRLPIETKVVPPADRRTVERFIDREIADGGQVFVICPLIESSEAEELSEVKSVEAEAKRLKESFPKRRIAVLHGRMAPAEKDAVMHAFKARESDILVSTAVIEVGIDVPNAAIIVIEGAERFGLAQLHQFRGRVGRGERKSHCFLFTTTPSQARSERLKAMEQHDSGFMLAEIDLNLRGPGELFGLRQSGIPDMQIRRMFRPELVVRARHAVEKALGLEESGSFVMG